MNGLVTILLFPFWLIWLVAAWVFSGVFRVVGWFKTDKVSDTYGDAAWADIKALTPHFTQNGFYLARVKDGWVWKRIFTKPEANVLLIATRGTGKSLTMGGTIRYAAQAKDKPDMIVNDPEGGLERLCREKLEKQGYKVITLNVINPSTGDYYNPFSFLRRDVPYAFDRDCDTFLHALMPNDASTRDDHFQEAARQITLGIMRTLPPYKQSLYHLAEAMSTNSAALQKEYDKLVAGKGHAIERASANQFTAAGDRERGSFTTTIVRKMMVMLRDSVRTVTNFYQSAGPSHNLGWTWETVFDGEQPTAVFIRAGLGEEAFLARLIFTIAVETRNRMWLQMGDKYTLIKQHEPKRKVPEPKFRRKLYLIVDEGHSLGNCTALVKAVEEQRKMGVNVFACYLSLDIIRQTVSNATTFLSNCNLAVFGGFTEKALADDLSRAFGPKTIKTKHGEDGVPLIRPDELMNLDGKKMAIKMDGLNVLAYKNWEIRKGNVKY